MEAELKKEHDADVTLDRGSGGIFEIWADGNLVYTKAETGRFPKPGEATDLLR